MWFPHIPVTLLVFLAALWLLYATIGQQWRGLLAQFADGQFAIAPSLLPPIIIGGGLLIMAIGLLLRSRVAWVMALVLTVTALANVYFDGYDHSLKLFVYLIAITWVLIASWKSFDHASITASTLFAISSVFMLFCYATFGALYIGSEFDPPIHNIVTALYFATVTMSTVGYGDITPQTPEAQLFTVSLIILGVAVFATSLTAIIAPLMSRSLQRIANRKANQMKREDHFVVLGASTLAQNTARELRSRGQPVTRVFRQKSNDESQDECDMVIGDPGDAETLKKAGCGKATAVLAMFEDDSENAFAILAVRELGGKAQTVAAVNNPRNLSRIRLVQPDVVIAPQILGGELAAMLVCGEEVTADYVINRVFHGSNKTDDTPPESA